MCVIALVENVRPSEEQIAQMWEQNPKGGGGVAWRETIRPDEAARWGITVSAPVEVVHWRKGLNKDDMQALNRTLPMPYILHFRQPSHDTSESLLACHPFQIDEDATTGFEGVTTGWVLFHNGFWAEWRRKAEALAIAGFGTAGFSGLPSGAWSDTRAMAWAAYHLGGKHGKFGFLEMVNEKVLCLGPGELDIEMFGGPWLAERPPASDKTFVVSNVTWRHQHVGFRTNDRRHTHTPLLNAANDVLTGKSGGTSQPGSFPCSHGRTEGTAGQGGDQQKQVQKGAAEALPGAGQSKSGCSLDHSWGDGQYRTCTGCGRAKSAGQYIDNSWLCWQCWSVNQKKETKTTLWVGTCATCRGQASGMKTILGDEWICMVCWETTGKPRTYYARDRAVA